MGPFGLLEIAILGGIALAFFGGGRLGDLGGALGKTIRGFKESVRDEPRAVAPPGDEKPHAAP